MEKVDIIDESISHYKRLIGWVSKQIQTGLIDRDKMLNELGEDWHRKYCALCTHYRLINVHTEKEDCNNCPYASEFGTCETGEMNAWRQTHYALTWGDLLDKLKLVLEQLVTLKRSTYIYTVGYGDRKPEELVEMLKTNKIKTVVDVRLRPDKSWSGKYKKTKNEEKGIEKVFKGTGIRYISVIELGNIFGDDLLWREKFKIYLEKIGYLLIQKLEELDEPICLMCCEKDASKCHRELIAEYLAKRNGQIIEHLF